MFSALSSAVSSGSKKLIISSLHLRHHCGDFLAKSFNIRPNRPKWPYSLGLGSETLLKWGCMSSLRQREAAGFSTGGEVVPLAESSDLTFICLCLLCIGVSPLGRWSFHLSGRGFRSRWVGLGFYPNLS